MRLVSQRARLSASLFRFAFPQLSGLIKKDASSSISGNRRSVFASRTSNESLKLILFRSSMGVAARPPTSRISIVRSFPSASTKIAVSLSISVNSLATTLCRGHQFYGTLRTGRLIATGANSLFAENSALLPLICKESTDATSRRKNGRNVPAFQGVRSEHLFQPARVSEQRLFQVLPDCAKKQPAPGSSFLPYECRMM
jgi:hypothetical protein